VNLERRKKYLERNKKFIKEQRAERRAELPAIEKTQTPILDKMVASRALVDEERHWLEGDAPSLVAKANRKYKVAKSITDDIACRRSEQE
jgi:hypothetical protein